MRIDAPFIHCPTCKGTGYETWHNLEENLCVSCGGSGRIYFERPKVQLSLGWRLVIVFAAVMLGAMLLYWFILAPALAALAGAE